MQWSRITWLATLGIVAATLVLSAGQVSAGTIRLTQNGTLKNDGVTITKNFSSVIIGAPNPTTNEFGLMNVGVGSASGQITPGGSATVTPTTFSLLTAGATSLIIAGITTSGGVAGLRTGTITVHTTTGLPTDQDDIFNLRVNVHDHSNSSFDEVFDMDTLSFDFGAFSTGDPIVSMQLSLTNLVATTGFTAGLDLDSIVGSGDTSVLTTGLTPFKNQSAGSGSTSFFDVFFNPSTHGTFAATYTLHFSDEDLPGATNNHNLTLLLQGTAVPEPATWLLLTTGLVGLLSYRWRRWMT